jgi:ABC-type antimicrobial peptide transport system permease subunit
MRLTVVGLAIGIGSAFALSRFLQGMLFGVTATDPASFAVASALLIVATLAACYLPARRATKIDPSCALRAE